MKPSMPRQSRLQCDSCSFHNNATLKKERQPNGMSKLVATYHATNCLLNHGVNC
jgi:hypothetical protein